VIFGFVSLCKWRHGNPKYKSFIFAILFRWEIEKYEFCHKVVGPQLFDSRIYESANVVENRHWENIWGHRAYFIFCPPVRNFLFIFLLKRSVRDSLLTEWAVSLISWQFVSMWSDTGLNNMLEDTCSFEALINK
jgi:hypothetical protein